MIFTITLDVELYLLLRLSQDIILFISIGCEFTYAKWKKCTIAIEILDRYYGDGKLGAVVIILQFWGKHKVHLTKKFEL